jgi:hypothetical protein
MRYKHKPNEVNVVRWNGVNSLEIENTIGAENVLYKPFDNEDTRAGNVEEYGKLFILVDNSFITIPMHSFIVIDEEKNITIYEQEEKFNKDYEIIE